ncbi:hypothetical protein ACHAWO_008305 [Cyclotella atomus]|uniref:Uncharacterized protein n=1 Tax=Cyclotella atomus TaxID=382360 RepID=A0ABD3P395_9STRA
MYARCLAAVVSKNTAHAEEEERLNESPTRKYLRDEVAVALQKQGQSMKTKAAKIGGDVDLGSIVQISLSDVDTVKVDGKVLTLVVVEKVEATKELMGLDTIFTTWKVKAALTVREAARLMLMVGGQEMRDGDGKKQIMDVRRTLNVFVDHAAKGDTIQNVPKQYKWLGWDGVFYVFACH